MITKIARHFCFGKVNLFEHVTMAPPDPILGTAAAFASDPSKDKVNLGIGAYRDENGKPYIFKAVKAAEEKIRQDNFNKVRYRLN